MNTFDLRDRASLQQIDAAVGARLRALRIGQGISQETLAKSIGLTFQQVQKYERGSNRIGASRLFAISQALGVSPAYFFKDVSAAGVTDPELPLDRLTLETVRQLGRCDRDTRQKLHEVVRLFANNALIAEAVVEEEAA